MKLPKVAKEDLENGREYVYLPKCHELGVHVGISLGASGALIVNSVRDTKYVGIPLEQVFFGDFYGPIELERE